MSMLNKFSPSKTRKKGRESEGSSILPETHVGPVQKIVQDEPSNLRSEMIDQYSYQPDQADQPEQLNSNDNISKKLATLEHIATNEQKQLYVTDVPSFGLLELLPMCEESLLRSMWGPHEPKTLKLQSLKRDYLNTKLGLVSEYRQEIKVEAFKDWMYFYNGLPILIEEIKSLSGFFREYLDVDEVIIFYNTGEYIIEPAGYCSFWNKSRLNKFFSGSLRELSHTEVQNDSTCLKCLLNTSCPFRRHQQIAK